MMALFPTARVQTTAVMIVGPHFINYDPLFFDPKPNLTSDLLVTSDVIYVSCNAHGFGTNKVNK